MYLVSTTALFLAAHLVSAFNPATDRAVCREGYPCLTSFKWCGLPGDANQGCTYPEDAYPYYNRDFPSNPAALMAGTRYNLSWANFNRDYPVEVRWSFGTSQANYPDALGNGSWSRNFSSDVSSFEFSFAELINEYPTTTSDLSRAEVYGLIGTGFSTISVTQPEAPEPSQGQSSGDSSDQFIVFSTYARIYLDTQSDITKSNLDRKWTLGVGVGVGIGAPLLMAAAFVAGWLFGKRKGKKVLASESKKLSASS